MVLLFEVTVEGVPVGKRIRELQELDVRKTKSDSVSKNQMATTPSVVFLATAQILLHLTLGNYSLNSKITTLGETCIFELRL